MNKTEEKPEEKVDRLMLEAMEIAKQPQKAVRFL